MEQTKKFVSAAAIIFVGVTLAMIVTANLQAHMPALMGKKA